MGKRRWVNRYGTETHLLRPFQSFDSCQETWFSDRALNQGEDIGRLFVILWSRASIVGAVYGKRVGRGYKKGRVYVDEAGVYMVDIEMKVESEDWGDEKVGLLYIPSISSNEPTSLPGLVPLTRRVNFDSAHT